MREPRLQGKDWNTACGEMQYESESQSSSSRFIQRALDILCRKQTKVKARLRLGTWTREEEIETEHRSTRTT